MMDVGDVRFHIWTEVELRMMLPVEELCANRDQSEPDLFLETLEDTKVMEGAVVVDDETDLPLVSRFVN